jgi:hypothetical protein
MLKRYNARAIGNNAQRVKVVDWKNNLHDLLDVYDERPEGKMSPSEIMVSKEFNMSGARCFSITGISTLLGMIKAVENLNYYEVIEPTRLVKMYFDVDLKIDECTSFVHKFGQKRALKCGLDFTLENFTKSTVCCGIPDATVGLKLPELDGSTAVITKNDQATPKIFFSMDIAAWRDNAEDPIGKLLRHFTDGLEIPVSTSISPITSKQDWRKSRYVRHFLLSTSA